MNIVSINDRHQIDKDVEDVLQPLMEFMDGKYVTVQLLLFLRFNFLHILKLFSMLISFSLFEGGICKPLCFLCKNLMLSKDLLIRITIEC